jgi:uncharacterized linocin/CFP29 family protein
MNILKKSLAPVTDRAWEEINEQAKKVFSSNLSARHFVDIDGPKGLQFASVARGELILQEKKGNDKVNYGIHAVQPLVEVRAPFELNIRDLDNLERGAKDVPLDNLEKAARSIARFEEQAIYDGLNEAGIEGLKASSSFGALSFSAKPEEIMHAVARGIAEMRNAAVEGPYTLVMDMKRWEKLSSIIEGYPFRMQLENLLGGEIILAPQIKGTYLVSEMKGNFTLTVGQDLSIGYEGHDRQKVYLYFTESFTFQVHEPSAILLIN